MKYVIILNLIENIQFLYACINVYKCFHPPSHTVELKTTNNLLQADSYGGASQSKNRRFLHNQIQIKNKFKQTAPLTFLTFKKMVMEC